MAPMGTNLQNIDGSVSENLVDYFEARARGGVGMIISPFAAINDKQRLFSFGAYNDRMRPGINRLAETAQKFGAKFFLQIAHYGGKADPQVTGKRPVAPSSISSDLYKTVPRKLSKGEIEEIIDSFVQAARRAKMAGCDGIELHGAHSYLVGEFMSPHANHREDEYGGDFRGRMRFPTLIMKGIQEVCGEEFPIGFKFSAHEHLENGVDQDLALRIAGYMEDLGVAYLHVASTASTMNKATYCKYPSVPSLYSKEAPLVPLAEKVKNSGVSVPVIATGGISEPELAEEILQDGKANMVALGRALLADPAWSRKAREGERIIPCIRCNQCHIREVMDRKEIGCAVNASTGRERKYQLKGTANPKRVLFIGGGPANMEGAKIAAERGHDVTLIEAKDELGGKLRLGCIPEFKSEIGSLLDYYKEELEESPVEVKLNTAGTMELIREENPQVVVFGNGAKEIVPDIPGIERENVIPVTEFYEQQVEIQPGEKVVVLGSGFVGAETAWYVSELGAEVWLLDQLPLAKILADEHPTNRSTLLAKLEERNVQLLPEIEVNKVNSDHLIIESSESNQEELPYDTIILATGFKPVENFSQEVEKAIGCEVHEIGDCVEARNIYHAVQEGAHVGRELDS